MKRIIIIGSGMGGLAAGIYGQLNGFDTTIFEAHTLPGGQCTSWPRKGYKFDACVHSFNGCKPQTRFNAFWQELGVLPCEIIRRNEFVSAVFPDGTYFHNYLDPEKTRQHLKELSPEDDVLIDEYINGLKLCSTEMDWFGITHFGSLWEKLSLLPFMLQRLKYFKYTMGEFGERFKSPLLQRAFPNLRTSIPIIPLFAYLCEYGAAINGDIGWPRGGGMTVSNNMAARYIKLGGTIHYGKKVEKILTDNDEACGVVLEDGTKHKADFVVSNADGRKTILQMLSGKYINKKVSMYCEPNPDATIHGSAYVCLGVKRDLTAYPSTLLIFLDKPEIIGGETYDHLDMQIYGFDDSMAPAGKGIIKVELFSRPSFFEKLSKDKKTYQAEKERIADQVITLLDKQFPNLRNDIEVVDVSTLHTWEHFMGGTEGHNNYPNKNVRPGSLRHVIGILFGLDNTFTLPGLKNFYFAGQWVTSMGSLALNALSGRSVVRKICKQCGVKFQQSDNKHF